MGPFNAGIIGNTVYLKEILRQKKGTYLMSDFEDRYFEHLPPGLGFTLLQTNMEPDLQEIHSFF